ncbi:hypothetical protein [Aeoliella sp.]|uniref:hypothetical protein n=1 Tax=Aeoliella sp. TaxID=2795800 RepID=UPI003CCC29B5
MSTTCIYCGEPATGRDHVPPVCLFSKPRPSNLITVPACEQHNGKQSKDDEFFRLQLCARTEAGKSPGILKHYKAIERSFRRPEASGLVEKWNEHTRIRWDTSAGGILQPRYQIRQDFQRQAMVAGRIVRGLYYHEVGEMLPLTVNALAIMDLAFDEIPSPQRETLDQIRADLFDAPHKVVSENEFSYRWIPVDEREFMSVWHLSFFESIWCLGVTNGPDTEWNFDIASGESPKRSDSQSKGTL